MKAGTGPRHIIVSGDNKFAYLLNELTAMVTTLSLDQKTGLLTEVSEASALAPDTRSSRARRAARPGRVRSRATCSNDIWASTCISRPTASSSTPRSAPAARSAPQCRRGHRQAYLPVKHTGREAAARLPHPPQRQVHGRQRRTVGHGLGLRDRGGRRAQAAEPVSDGKDSTGWRSSTSTNRYLVIPAAFARHVRECCGLTGVHSWNGRCRFWRMVTSGSPTARRAQKVRCAMLKVGPADAAARTPTSTSPG